MMQPCSHCCHSNRPFARYCAMCGHALSEAPLPPALPRGRAPQRAARGRAWGVVLLLGMLAGVGGLWTTLVVRRAHERQRFQPHHAWHQIPRVNELITRPPRAPAAPRQVGSTPSGASADRQPSTTVRIALDADKARLVADLLAPSHVKVIVTRHYEAITLSGDPDEVRIVKRFADLISRYRGMRPGDIDLQLRSDAPAWTARTSINLRPEQASAFESLLDLPDVPIGIIRSRTGVDVISNPADAATVEAFLRILNGG